MEELLAQLTHRDNYFVSERTKEIFENLHAQLWVIRDEGRIVAITILTFICAFSQKRAQIDDIVVDESIRGKGLGKSILTAVITEAKNQGATCIDLTSSPKRETAIAFYQKMGFEKRDTNVFRLAL